MNKLLSGPRFRSGGGIGTRKSFPGAAVYNDFRDPCYANGDDPTCRPVPIDGLGRQADTHSFVDHRTPGNNNQSARCFQTVFALCLQYVSTVHTRRDTSGRAWNEACVNHACGVLTVLTSADTVLTSVHGASSMATPRYKLCARCANIACPVLTQNLRNAYAMLTLSPPCPCIPPTINAFTLF